MILFLREVPEHSCSKILRNPHRPKQNLSSTAFPAARTSPENRRGRGASTRGKSAQKPSTHTFFTTLRAHAVLRRAGANGLVVRLAELSSRRHWVTDGGAGWLRHASPTPLAGEVADRVEKRGGQGGHCESGRRCGRRGHCVQGSEVPVFF